jgi:predicted metal-dependent hydrolase
VEHMTIGNIDIAVTFKAIKNIHLSVHPPMGAVTIAAPKHLDPDIIRVFAIGKISWIRKERARFVNQLREEPKTYIAQESHYFMGKRYLLRVSEGSRSKVILHHNHIELVVPKDATHEKKEAVLYRWYRVELKKELQLMVEEWESKMSVKATSFAVRKMKTKWGSCNNHDGRILFNTELAKKPKECIEYVVVHELVHLLERKHNKRFVLLMNGFLGGWNERRRMLNESAI